MNIGYGDDGYFYPLLCDINIPARESALNYLDLL